MDILIIAQYMQAPGEHENDRFKYLCEMLTQCPDNNVEAVTMDFSHHFKKYRNVSAASLDALPYDMTFIHVTKYSKNVSPMRLLSNHVMGKNLSEYLRGRKKPDVLYAAVPSLDAAYAAALYCRENGVRFIIDIQDLWPEAFRMVLDNPLVNRLIYRQMEKEADFIYSSADEIIAVSQTYADRAMRVNTKCKKATVVYLGTEKVDFDMHKAPVLASKSTVELPDDKLKVAYIGTLGSSYDIPVVLEAMRLLEPELLSQILLVVMGDGPRKTEFMKLAIGLPAVFTDRLSYPEMVYSLCKCDIAVNPIIPGAAGSIINKHMDYAMAGLPVINTQECPEYRNMLDEFESGINCKCGDAGAVAEALSQLIIDAELRNHLGCNQRIMAEKLFDRAVSYEKIFIAIVRGHQGEKEKL